MPAKEDGTRMFDQCVGIRDRKLKVLGQAIDGASANVSADDRAMVPPTGRSDLGSRQGGKMRSTASTTASAIGIIGDQDRLGCRVIRLGSAGHRDPGRIVLGIGNTRISEVRRCCDRPSRRPTA